MKWNTRVGVIDGDEGRVAVQHPYYGQTHQARGAAQPAMAYSLPAKEVDGLQPQVLRRPGLVGGGDVGKVAREGRRGARKRGRCLTMVEERQSRRNNSCGELYLASMAAEWLCRPQERARWRGEGDPLPPVG